MKRWMQNNTASLAGKVVAISGSTGGLGHALCEQFVALGAQLVLLDRNQAKLTELCAHLKRKYPGCRVGYVIMDLSDIASVDTAAEILQRKPLDVLICNAGAYAVPRFITSSGLDNVFQINHAAPYYLVRRLMPILAKRQGRVVIVGSIAHNYSKTDPDDVDFRTRKKASLVYGNAKRYLMFSMYDLFDGREDVTLAVTHPGIAVTGITAHYPKWLYALIKYPMKVIFMKPRRACLSILRGVFEPTANCEWIGPRLFDVWGMPRKRRLTTCSAEEQARISAKAERSYRDMCRQLEREDKA
ncbi:MAG: SDR family NAD(P)-dependent oxidoreductase [Clostridia bacterium]|nr:SDR family NAD(P)-dependent oxidoreductase [Clostridia bacterium]